MRPSQRDDRPDLVADFPLHQGEKALVDVAEKVSQAARLAARSQHRQRRLSQTALLAIAV